MPDGRTREVRAACDQCSWGGDSAAAAKRHHDATGHTTWAETKTITFWGDPLEAYLESIGARQVSR